MIYSADSPERTAASISKPIITTMIHQTAGYETPDLVMPLEMISIAVQKHSRYTPFSHHSRLSARSISAHTTAGALTTSLVDHARKASNIGYRTFDLPGPAIVTYDRLLRHIDGGVCTSGSSSRCHAIDVSHLSTWGARSTLCQPLPESHNSSHHSTPGTMLALCGCGAQTLSFHCAATGGPKFKLSSDNRSTCVHS